MSNLIIVGGGLAGSLAALALAERRPEVELLLLEGGETFGGNHVWSSFDSDVAPANRWLTDMLPRKHWDAHDVAFPKRRRTIPIGYSSLRSIDLDRVMRERLRPAQYRLGSGVAEVAPGCVTLTSGERLRAAAVIDARGPEALPGMRLGWQKFVGRLYRFKRPHAIKRPVIMDATVPQHDGYRFVYTLPFDEHALFLEDTYYSRERELDVANLRDRLDVEARKIGEEFEISGEEEGVLPVLIAGDFDAAWPADDPIPRIGARGLFFHPTTSYSFPDAVANACWLAGQRKLDSVALATTLRRRARKLFSNRQFYLMLDRLLFDVAEPGQEYRVLEHFYRLPAASIARFYAARLTLADKLRIVTGRPPVPLFKAIGTLLRTSQ